jgi:hypothetical protein
MSERNIKTLFLCVEREGIFSVPFSVVYLQLIIVAIIKLHALGSQ